MRTVIVHYHIYKNSGTSFERVLEHSFGDGHERFDGPYPFFTIEQDQLDRVIRRHRDSVAFSSHQVLLPQPTSLDYHALAAVFLRHPILRIGSIYRFKRQHDDGTKTSANARKYDWAEWIEAAFRVGGELPQISNGQTRHLSGTYGRAPLTRRHSDMLEFDLTTARRNLANVELLGRTDHFEEDVQRFAQITAQYGLELRIPKQTRHNTTADHDAPLEARVEKLLAPLGDELRAKLLAANHQDLALYGYAHQLIETRRGVA